MKYKNLVYASAMVMATLLTFSAVKATAQTTANGPYYALPSWDQTLPSSTRFIVLSNFNSQAVLDRETGLVWERSPDPNAATNWFAAKNVCNNKVLGNRKGWKIPTAQELASLVDPSVASPGPTLPSGHPFSNVQSSYYWTATTRALDTNFAWGVRFNDGGVFNDNNKLESYFVWCVRGGQGVDIQ